MTLTTGSPASAMTLAQGWHSSCSMVTLQHVCLVNMGAARVLLGRLTHDPPPPALSSTHTYRTHLLGYIKEMPFLGLFDDIKGTTKYVGERATSCSQHQRPALFWSCPCIRFA